MSVELPVQVFYIAHIILGASVLLCLYRVIIGPTTYDRAIALDLMGFVAIGIITVFSIQTRALNYFPVILVISILGFFGLVAVAKFLFGGDLIDRNR